MRKFSKVIIILAAAAPIALTIGADLSWAGDAAAGKIIFETRCHTCHAALPYTGRIGDANLAAFLANPKRYNPKTAMTFPGLRSKKDIEDVIAYITGNH